jgi:hypothetical protein
MVKHCKEMFTNRSDYSRRRRRLPILVLLLVAGSSCFSQGLQIWASTGVSTARNKSFLNFADNYNRYVGTLVDKPLRGFGIGTTLNFGLTYDFGDEEFGGEATVFTSNLASTAKVDFFGDEHRRFELRRHLAGLELALGPRFGNSAVYLGFGFQMGNTILDSYFIYADETESHGRERPWNGIYQGFNASTLHSAKYEFRAGERIRLFARLSYTRDLGNKGHLSDHDTRNGWTETWVTSTMLPLSVEQYIATLDQPLTAPYAGPWVMNKFNSLSLQVGVGFVVSKNAGE